MHLVCTTDFIHYTGAVCTDRDYEFEQLYPITQKPAPNGAVEIPMEILSELQKNYGKPEPVLLHAVEESPISPQNREKNRLSGKSHCGVYKRYAGSSGKSAGICPKLIG